MEFGLIIKKAMKKRKFLRIKYKTAKVRIKHTLAVLLKLKSLGAVFRQKNSPHRRRYGRRWGWQSESLRPSDHRNSPVPSR